MRLLTLNSNDELSITKDLVNHAEPYAILSHTWGEDEDEVIFSDLSSGRGNNKAGYRKIKFCGRQSRRDGLRYFWVDTCCIDKANHVELSEAITSMFRWYRNAAKCYVYLSDVSAHTSQIYNQKAPLWESSFRASRWFKRGWTLQELLAPTYMEFFSLEEDFLGNKQQLEQQLCEITKIPVDALRGTPLSHFSVRERMRWAADRDTKKEEDRAYCLLGIFDVSMSLRYGEGEKAFTRLEKKVNNSSRYKEIMTWLVPATSEELQAKASTARHPDTGSTFLKGPLGSWLHAERGCNQLMWITGKSGTGKTTIFDPKSQPTVNILGPLVVEISKLQPRILEDLKATFERDKAREHTKTLEMRQLETGLVKYIPACGPVIFLIDALDESEDYTEIISCILRLVQQLSNLKVMVTSTRSAALAGISQSPCLSEYKMQSHEDIQTFVTATLSDHVALRDLSPECKENVNSVLIDKANNSFRWVCLTLNNLCKQRTGRQVVKALTQVPKDLNETYANMLGRISPADKTIAKEVLLWLCFAIRPMTLAELSEAAILEYSDTTLNQDSRLHRPEIILDICQGLLQCDVGGSRVKLAHSSVRDYLLSDYARCDGDSFFSFEPKSGNQVLMHKCLTYLMFDDFKSGLVKDYKALSSRKRDFPLFEYAAHNWGTHASRAATDGGVIVQKFFGTRHFPRGANYSAWVNCLIPKGDLHTAIHTEPLYYAASFGMTSIVQGLLSDPADIGLEIPGGRFGSTPLQVACFRGKEAAAKLLVAAGADFWSDDPGSGEPAWFWAQCNGWTALVGQMTRLRPDIVKTKELDEEKIRWGQSMKKIRK